MSNTPLTKAASVTATPTRGLKHGRPRTGAVTVTASRGAAALARTRAAVAAAVSRTIVEMDTRNAVASRPARINIFSDD